ncbi:alpha-1,3-fucosyl transferase [Helicobacter jaachi]|uniref:Alpha-1,3-fucosyl transferase n=1 Tax=Helicobacter jaachi TaxID=1677920 RepID=A0A4U8TB04_9HELI|nr:glycosyltransferase family 10 [Helicobacter jaachi]TLD96864.1 alpha-1,3-fucosyl transferase [Helicobacter jaachi]
MKQIRIAFCDFGDMQGIANALCEMLKKHFEVILDSITPSYIFYSVFGSEHIKYDCVRIFFTGENVSPNFNICDYAIGFEHLHFLDRYMRYPLYLFYEADYTRALHKHSLITPQTLAQKKRFCNFIVSNGHNADPYREQVFHELCKFKRVDSGGKYLNNIGAPLKDKFAFQKECLFSLCFENSSSPGYLTEKLIQAAGAQTIPIYWGDTLLKGALFNGGGVNTQALIYAHDFACLQDLIAHIKDIESNPKKQLTILQTPLFLDTNHKEQFDEKLEAFLVHIFNQPYAQAFRRAYPKNSEEKRYKYYARFISALKLPKRAISWLRAR